MADQGAPAGRAGVGAEAESLIDVLVGALEADADPNVRNLERQFLPQFQQLLKSELAFVHRACRLNAEQRLQITKAAREGLGVAVRQYAVAQNRMRHGRVRHVSQTMADPRDLVQKLLAAIVEKELAREQAEQYQQECEKRAASRKRAVVLNLVAILDQELVLTAEQREKLVQSLSSDYQDAWDHWLQMLAHHNRFLPQVPDECVAPLLSETQKAVWREARKHAAFIGGRFPVAPAMVMINDAVLEEVEAVIEEVDSDQ